jgi:2-phosphosulfolactate phosphatase
VARVAQSYGPRIGLVPAGEQWPDGALRPSLEDWLGAGAILSHLAGSISPEAELARGAFLRHSVDIAGVIEASASGRELLARGWSEDVALATELGVSSCAPVLIERAYQDCQARIGVAAI